MAFMDGDYLSEVFSDPAIHAEMIGCKNRTTSYKAAIMEYSDRMKGKIVMDVGAGRIHCCLFSPIFT